MLYHMAEVPRLIARKPVSIAIWWRQRPAVFVFGRDVG